MPPDEPALPSDFQSDIDAIGAIAAVPTILDVVCRTTGMGFAAVARVTEDRWIACQVLDHVAFGLVPGGELKVETTICNEIRDSRQAVVIDHVAEDPLYAAHHTPAMYGLQSYISMPIILADGRFFGTLCAIDPKPASLKTPAVIGMFELFAQLIAFHLDAHERIATSRASLDEELNRSELRDQFIAVLGHDLRNPLASIDAGTNMLLRTPLDAKAKTIVELMQGTVSRMSGLIENVLDFARGRLGGGVTLNREDGRPLEPTLEQVIAELRSGWPDRDIETRFALSEPVSCDHVRLAQLLSNLIGNALTHGAAGAPVLVEANSADGIFELSVANQGEPIPPTMQARLFQPFYRGQARPSLQGLGLGLYIASEIAAAHGGTLGLVSTPDQTRFTFRMPSGPRPLL